MLIFFAIFQKQELSSIRSSSCRVPYTRTHDMNGGKKNFFSLSSSCSGRSRRGGRRQLPKDKGTFERKKGDGRGKVERRKEAVSAAAAAMA